MFQALPAILRKHNRLLLFIQARADLLAAGIAVLPLITIENVSTGIFTNGYF